MLIVKPRSTLLSQHTLEHLTKNLAWCCQTMKWHEKGWHWAFAHLFSSSFSNTSWRRVARVCASVCICLKCWMTDATCVCLKAFSMLSVGLTKNSETLARDTFHCWQQKSQILVQRFCFFNNEKSTKDLKKCLSIFFFTFVSMRLIRGSWQLSFSPCVCIDELAWHGTTLTSQWQVLIFCLFVDLLPVHRREGGWCHCFVLLLSCRWTSFLDIGAWQLFN